MRGDAARSRHFDLAGPRACSDPSQSRMGVEAELLTLRERFIMNAPLTSGKSLFNGRSIAVVVTVVIVMLIGPHEASAKGGIKGDSRPPISRTEAATETSSRTDATPTEFSGCGGKRFRDPNSHRCRGPADWAPGSSLGNE